MFEERKLYKLHLNRQKWKQSKRCIFQQLFIKNKFRFFNNVCNDYTIFRVLCVCLQTITGTSQKNITQCLKITFLCCRNYRFIIFNASTIQSAKLQFLGVGCHRIIWIQNLPFAIVRELATEESQTASIHPQLLHTCNHKFD